MAQEKNNPIIEGSGAGVEFTKKPGFNWKEFFKVDWKDSWNWILLVIAMIILYFSVKSIMAALMK